MKKKSLTVWFTTFILVLMPLIVTQIRGEDGTTIYVDDDGGADYTEIQDAIDAASDGDTIYVYSGTYIEHVVIDKLIKLQGEDKDTTIIDAGGSGDTIYVTVNDVEITNFKITNSGMYESDAGVDVRSDFVSIVGNKFTLNRRDGVQLFGSNNTVADNVIVDNKCGIECRDGSRDNYITDNEISDSDSSGLWIHSSDANIVRNNLVSGNGVSGITIIASVDNLIDKNEITDNEGLGLYLMYRVYDNIISHNNIMSNEKGILLYSPPGDNNFIHHNNFIDNDQNAHDALTNFWDDDISEGNYWDDYGGVDEDDDNIGDTPYDIPEGSNQDRYPLMEPWSDENQPPFQPLDPNPDDDAISVSIHADLSWTGGDPDTDDIVTYDVYFGTINPPPQVATDQTDTSYDLTTLIYNTQYYWKIVAWDNHGASTDGQIWNFTTMDILNNPPYSPSNPGPADDTTDVSINKDVTWTGGDPDAADTVTYDVYFGTANPPPKVTVNQSSTAYNSGTMSYETTYYWQIISWDNHGAYTEGSIWDFTTESESVPEQLDISVVPSIVSEGEDFIVTVMINDVAIAGASVKFLGISKNTDSNGEVTFTSSQVEDNTEYSITANYGDYDSVTTMLTVLNTFGWVYGNVCDASGSPIKTVQVCVFLSAEENRCMFTDDEGNYDILVPVGTYSTEASKEGYISTTKEATILKDKRTELNFILQKEENQSEISTDASEQLIKEKIAAESKNIAAMIDFGLSENDILYYSDNINIELNSTEEIISFTVSAENGTNGTIVVIHISEGGVLSDLDNVTVTYDGVTINELVDIETFFDIRGNTDLGWLRFLTKTGLYIFVRVPHFSEHRITISSIGGVIGEVVETLGGITAVILYIIFCIIVVIAATVHIKYIWRK